MAMTRHEVQSQKLGASLLLFYYPGLYKGVLSVQFVLGGGSFCHVITIRLDPTISQNWVTVYLPDDECWLVP